MITIKIPDNFLAERTYIVEILFGEFLGLEFNINYAGNEHYEILLQNNNSLTIKNDFFSKFDNDSLDYLDQKNIPKNIEYSRNRFSLEDDIPVIYGNDFMEVSENKIECGIDIFASSFFMLTRWEEYVNKSRDLHDRFPSIESIAVQNKFLDRPVVNEYVEMLWNMLDYLGCVQNRKEYIFQPFLTHDVDWIQLFKNWKHFFRLLGGDITVRKDISSALKRLIQYFQVKTGVIRDPYDTFNWLLDMSENAGLKSHFYFMSGGVTAFDNNYHIKDDKTLEIIKTIKNRGHVIGFHASYSTCNDKNQWKKEKDLLEKATAYEISEGRQHYLNFQVPYTWQIWEDNGMAIDSTLCYADQEGYRCGTCYEYSVFNILTRKRLKLKEYPLIIMDTSLVYYQESGPDEVLKKIRGLIDKTKKFKGRFVLLWHNSFFNVGNVKINQDIYLKILNMLK